MVVAVMLLLISSQSLSMSVVYCARSVSVTVIFASSFFRDEYRVLFGICLASALNRAVVNWLTVALPIFKEHTKHRHLSDAMHASFGICIS